ncbi:DUF2946 family protein [Nitrospirillum viridazoti]|uniref:DUF2946 family protein n=1 Tax=Nitrospirillum amazonense TaxID=28077 RepID=A0A560HZZ0_9PROT|nr:DUF2946 family protein [Nitrospirillum amazonense]TWB52222.1 DUF2946 family protein [Nitrospirillum amazonense]
MTRRTAHNRLDRARRNSGRRLIAWLTLALLAIDVMAAGVLPLRMRAAQADPDTAYILCGPASPASGHKNSDASRHGTGGHAQPFCAYCLPFLHGGMALPSPVPLPLPRLAGRLDLTSAVSPAETTPYRQSAYPRGPPARA